MSAAAPALDVSRLPTVVVDRRALVWWGTLGMIVIESTMFALAIATYLYLRDLAPAWPPETVARPNLKFPIINLAVLLLSLVPAIAADRTAHARNRRGVQISLGANLALGLVFLGLRVKEFEALGCRWNSNVYGSVTWTILGLHTSHVIASLIETLVIWLVFLFKPVKETHYLDARLDGVYWYFVVGAWLVLFTLIFLVPWIG